MAVGCFVLLAYEQADAEHSARKNLAHFWAGNNWADLLDAITIPLAYTSALIKFTLVFVIAQLYNDNVYSMTQYRSNDP